MNEELDTNTERGRCEAETSKGSRCQRQGRYDGYHGEILCAFHLDAYEAVLLASRTAQQIPSFAGQSIEERL